MTPVIDNIVLACPGNSDESYQREARSLASFYAELLDMRFKREDWFVIADKDEPDGSARLAFGDGPIDDYQPPRWPDPEYPQQMHIDIPAYDLAAAEELARRLGATLLRKDDEHRVYADPVGHPFCMYRADSSDDGEQADDDRAPLGRIGRVVIDCFSPRALAAFYAELLDMPTRELDTPERVVIARVDGRMPALAFQHAQFSAPRWPDPAFPQQVHLDLWMNNQDPEPARELAHRLGAIRLPDIGGSQPVFADPAGHPFCL